MPGEFITNEENMARAPKPTPIEAAAAAAAAVEPAAPAKKRATVTAAFDGVRDGDVYPVPFNPGDEIEGNLAAAMIDAGLAGEIEG